VGLWVADSEPRSGERKPVWKAGFYRPFRGLWLFLPGSHGFRHSVAGFMVHFKKMICAFVSTVKDFQFAIGEFIGYLANMTIAENKFLKEAIKQGLRMQHRFLAEPVLARTGKGYLKSEGVATLQRIKASLKKSKSA
jgi:hypothetical protein